MPSSHREVATTALRHGVPVLSEKPLADTVAAGLAMVAASVCVCMSSPRTASATQ